MLGREAVGGVRVRVAAQLAERGRQRAHRVPLGERLQPARQRLRRARTTFDTNVSGKMTREADLLRDLDRRHRQPEPDADPRHREGEQRAAAPTPARKSAMPLWTRQPTARPVSISTTRMPGVVDDVGDGAAAEHRRAGHRQRAEPVDDALVDVVGHADRGRDRGEADRLHEDAGHQVLAVGAAAGQRDRAAEDEREQQHEHDRLEDREDRELRDARDPLEVAPGDDEAVGDGVPDAAARHGRASPSCAVLPVGASARLLGARGRSGSGRRRPASAGAGRCRRSRSPASSRSRTTSTSCCAPPSRGDRHPARVLVERRARAAVAAPAARAARARSAASRTTTSIRSPPTCDFSSSAVPRAMILPVVDDRDRRRPARRPPRGTASSAAASCPPGPGRG